jgi:hypothetical protein
VEREGVAGMPPDRKGVLERLSMYREQYQPTEINA